MLNKICLASVALLLAPAAFAQTQTVTTTNYSSAVQLTTGNGCTVTGITTLTYNPATGSITTNGTGGSCAGGSTNPPPPTASVTLAISTSTYQLPSANVAAAVAPVITWTNNTAAAAVTCTLTPTNGFTATASGNTFTLSTPTAAGTFTFQPTCTASGYTVVVSPAAVSLTVSGGTPPPPDCASSPAAALGTKSLPRQCSGDVAFLPGPLTTYSGALTDWGQLLGSRSFPSYAYSGYSPTFTIQSGYYVALQFTPNASGAFQLVANPSFGDAGMVSLSSTPGAFIPGSAGLICSFARGAANSMYVGTSASICPVQQGTTYYINFVDADYSGNALCYGGRANTCATSQVSYTIYTSN